MEQKTTYPRQHSLSGRGALPGLVDSELVADSHSVLFYHTSNMVRIANQIIYSDVSQCLLADCKVMQVSAILSKRVNPKMMSVLFTDLFRINMLLFEYLICLAFKKYHQIYMLSVLTPFFPRKMACVEVQLDAGNRSGTLVYGVRSTKSIS